MDWTTPSSLWLLALVAGAAVLLWWALRRRRRAVATFGDPDLIARLTNAATNRSAWLRPGLLLAGMALLVLALAGPRVGTTEEEITHEGFDLVIALDLSRSMLAEDVAPNRLDRARGELRRLLPALRGNRIGLVFFAGEAFPQAPLTLDHSAIRLFLDVAAPDLMPLQGTNFERLVNTLIDSFDEEPEAEGDPARAVLLVSDGENQQGTDAELARRLEDAGILTFALGVGTPGGGRIPTGDADQPYHRDGDGNVVTTRLTPETLRTLSRSGGYFHIGRTDDTLDDLASALDRLDRATFDAIARRTPVDRYQWPLVLGMLALLAERLLPRQPEVTA